MNQNNKKLNAILSIALGSLISCGAYASDSWDSTYQTASRSDRAIADSLSSQRSSVSSQSGYEARNQISREEFAQNVDDMPSGLKNKIVNNFDNGPSLDSYDGNISKREIRERNYINRQKESKERIYNGESKQSASGSDSLKWHAKTCGVSENVGYSNYFGDPGYYNKHYPLVAPHLAEIEAIPLFREALLPDIDSDLRRFIADKQANRTVSMIDKQRTDTYRDFHTQGGQFEYTNQVYQQQKRAMKERSEKRSENMLYELYQELDDFKVPRSHYVNSYDNPNKMFGNFFSGSDLLNKCRLFWANGNTVLDNNYDNQGWMNQKRRIGIKPGMVVAQGVSPQGEPVAYKNLSKSAFSNRNQNPNSQRRADMYNERFSDQKSSFNSTETINRTFEGGVPDHLKGTMKQSGKALREDLLKSQEKSSSGVTFDSLY